MTDRTKNHVILFLLAAVAFLLGWGLRGERGAPAGERLEAEPLLEPQGRRSGDSKTEAEPLVFDSSQGGASVGNGFLAITGSYGIGTSVLYVFDTNSKQLAVYEARGGSKNSRRLFLVGARRIDLDLQLRGYNDESEWSYEQLLQKFRKKGLVDEPEATTPAKESGSGR